MNTNTKRIICWAGGNDWHEISRISADGMMADLVLDEDRGPKLVTPEPGDVLHSFFSLRGWRADHNKVNGTDLVIVHFSDANAWSTYTLGKTGSYGLACRRCHRLEVFGGAATRTAVIPLAEAAGWDVDEFRAVCPDCLTK